MELLDESDDELDEDDEEGDALDEESLEVLDELEPESLEAEFLPDSRLSVR